MYETLGAWVLLATNVVIPWGYFYAAAKVAPILPVPTWVRWAAIGFFATCAGTHLELALHQYLDGIDTDDLGHMLLIHIPQAGFIWAFVVGFRVSLVRLRAERHTTDAAAP